jgi:hypothetical protein
MREFNLLAVFINITVTIYQAINDNWAAFFGWLLSAFYTSYIYYHQYIINKKP